jgi:hypothetical protein
MEWAADDVADASRPAARPAIVAKAASAPVRRSAGPAAADAPAGVSVEIDDAPLLDGATGTIRGTVRDDLGAPVQAMVAAWERCYMDDFDADVPTETQADAEGRYVLEGLDPGVVWRVGARAGSHADAPPARVVLFSARRLDVTYDLVLPRNGSIETTVLDAAGSPLDHRTRILPLEREHWSELSRSDIAPGRYRVLVDVPNHAGDSRVVEVAPGETTRVEFRADEAVEISGALVDSDGSPVRKIEVVAVVADAALAPFDGTAVTQADGSFRIAGLRRTRYRLALADSTLFADGPEALLAPATGVTLRLRDDARATFRLVYPPGFPAADRSAEVAIVVFANGTTLRPSPRWELDKGTVRVPGGDDAELAITALHCATVYRGFRARAGELVDLGEMRPDLARDVVGRVVDSLGKPLQVAVVRCGAGAFSRRAVTGGDGAFRLERMPQSGVVLDVDAAGFVPVRVPCPDGSEAPLTVTLARGGVLWLRGETTGGAPLAGAAVRLADTAGTPLPFGPVALDDHGECAARLPPGRWRIAVAGCAPVDADVREGATTSVRLRAAADPR